MWDWRPPNLTEAPWPDLVLPIPVRLARSDTSSLGALASWRLESPIRGTDHGKPTRFRHTHSVASNPSTMSSAA
jgi:hypothetical protein